MCDDDIYREHLSVAGPEQSKLVRATRRKPGQPAPVAAARM